MTRNAFLTIAVCTAIALSYASSVAQETQVPSPGGYSLQNHRRREGQGTILEPCRATARGAEVR
jgi:hypothetical protein